MLSFDFRPIRQDEIKEEVRAYQTYADSFSREKALRQLLTYVITRAEHEPDLARIDRWYQRDAGRAGGTLPPISCEAALVDKRRVAILSSVPSLKCADKSVEARKKGLLVGICHSGFQSVAS